MSLISDNPADAALENPDAGDTSAQGAGHAHDRAPRSETGAFPLPLRVRIGVPLAILLVAVYAAACLVYNAPASAAQDRLKDSAATLMEPLFWQDWQLFAPNPGSENALVYLQTRIRQPTGEVVETSPVEVEQAVDRMPRNFRLNPTKLPGIFLAMDATAGRYTRAAIEIKKLPESRRQAAQHDLDQAFSATFLELQRFMSARAASLYPGQDVLAIRITFAHRPIVPFSQRYVRPQPAEPVKKMLVTSWMPYVQGVEQ